MSTKDLSYWKENAEEDYLQVPISVLRYISELEQRSYSEEEVKLITFEMCDWVLDNIDNQNVQSGKKFDEVIAKFKNK